MKVKKIKILFSRENKKTYFKLSSVDSFILYSMLSIKCFPKFHVIKISQTFNLNENYEQEMC